MGRAPIPEQETAVGIQIHGQKQLSSSYSSKITTTTMNSRTPKFSDGGKNPQPPPPPQQKKQVRRRLHTTRPYQERLLNMAEARREIVTALKFHRASMKKAEEQQRKKQNQIPSPPLHTIQSSRSNFYNDLGPIMPYSSLSPVSHLPLPAEFSIPSQPPLGLNLNFHDFDNISVNLYHSYNGNAASSIYSSSSPSSSSSPAEEILSSSSSAAVPLEQRVHQVIDEEEMRPIGGQHQIEQSGTMNMVNSAQCTSEEVKAEDVGYQPFDEVMEFPSWLGSCDSSLQHHLDDCFSKDFFQDLPLPW